ncbi:MAG TPA: hypothetical protein VMU80_04765 [Bryobacteraceae bacterium]|nr:hypothetical protein [Bryobacteraceae bacterium]
MIRFNSERLALLAAVLGLISLAPTMDAQTLCPEAPAAGMAPCILSSQYGNPPYDNQRQSHNRYETLLTSPNLQNGTSLSPAAFSPLLVEPGPGGASKPINPVYAQPLYVAGISVASNLAQNCNNLLVNGNPACNMLLAVTLYGSVWAWNADTGAVIWNRTGKVQGGVLNYLWYEDCGQTASIVSPIGSVPFAGIVSTPVIDVTGTAPLMYVVSACSTGGTAPATEWFLHQLNLQTGQDNSPSVEIASPNSNQTDEALPESTPVQFQGAQAIQRSGLLQVKVSTATPSQLIYIAFGAAVSESANPYHGWVFSYTTTKAGALNPKPMAAFNDTPFAPGPGNTGVPACTAGCTCTGGCTPSCVITGYSNAPNWCGHGGGIWMSSRGGAASVDANGNSHAFFGSGNGAFQLNSTQTAVANFGSSVLDFQLPAGGKPTGTPSSNYFTPKGGSKVVFTASLLGKTNCGTAAAPAPCPYTFESLNQNDWDMSTSGILLFSDNSQNQWLVTIDKTGIGYMLPQFSLGGYQQNDPNSWQFGAASSLCWTLPVAAYDNCHRVTSMALYQDADAVGTPYYLYYWPFSEQLTGVQVSNNTAVNPPGTVTVKGTTLYGHSTQFTKWLVAGDQLTINTTPPTTVTVLNVGSDTLLAISPGVNVTSPATFSYKGYLVNPIHPAVSSGPTNASYPGGALAITSNNGSGGVLWALTTLQTQPADPPTQECPTFTAMLNAYDAPTLNELWSSWNSQTGCEGGCFNIAVPAPAPACAAAAATFGLPTVVNGSIYIPAYNFTASGRSGIQVFCGTGSAACAAQ